MYTIHHEHNNTNICMPKNIQEDLPHVIEIGHSYPPPGYESNRMYRNCYVIHYVTQGKGTYFGQAFEAPCTFLLHPKNLQYYKFDSQLDTPTAEQYWIMFTGNDIPNWLTNAGFPDKPACLPCPYIHQAVEILQELQKQSSYIFQDDLCFMMSGLWRLLSLHAAASQGTQNRTNNTYVDVVRNYIHQNYASITSEDELAKLINVSTNYMHRLFKNETGTSPMHYLNDYRIRCAKSLLKRYDIPIYTISEMVGFSTPNYFCRVFQKHCGGVSPLEYRKKHRFS